MQKPGELDEFVFGRGWCIESRNATFGQGNDVLRPREPGFGTKLSKTEHNENGVEGSWMGWIGWLRWGMETNHACRIHPKIWHNVSNNNICAICFRTFAHDVVTLG